jgi:pimeloyl-ACP methyl ester carboxylesterase
LEVRSVDGLSIAYVQAGTGPALVLLHGFLFDSRAWARQIEGLSRHFTVIAWDPVGFRLMARSLADADTGAQLREVRAPTLLLWGEEDSRSPLSVATQLQTLIPDAKLVVIPGAGHLCNVEAPARFNDKVHRFCLERATA